MDRNDKFGVMREMVLNGTSDEALVIPDTVSMRLSSACVFNLFFTLIKKVSYKIRKDFWKIVEKLFALFVIATLE